MIELLAESTDLGNLLRELPPEVTGGLTFHLPLEVQALDVVGAAPRVIRQRVQTRLPDAFATGLIDPPLYRWAEERYAPVAMDLLSDDQHVRARAYTLIAPLGAGLAGAAFHGLIRLGYGALRRDASEVARGLAYLRTRRQVLFSPNGLRSSGQAILPAPNELAGTSIFDQLNLAAGSPDVLRTDDTNADIPAVRLLCREALRLLSKNPGSFVSVHSLDALHALIEFDGMVSGATSADEMPHGPLGDWWRAYSWSLRACAVLVDAAPLQKPVRPPATFSTLASLTDAALESCEVHDIKVVVALRRLVAFGVINEEVALEAGASKLATSECRV